ncbi:glycoside hydrolase family 6 protein [Saccharothrix luteola]|uniref:glycoside hydrolase family 6 protein n=1 Tax=Saccharothrix luteola TaxID=2893018 RepID=UPI001E621915|nr:glycoside hydrolase family 6 protein [Saccharothrix luteola]MCC8250647.1 glycoside hydrolase family 6 protein [Saccharothrix luteola]
MRSLIRVGHALTAAAIAAGLVVTAPAGASTAPHWSPRLDNPYVGARPYVNPEWSARAAAEPGGTAVAGQPTGVWLDSIASVHGADGTMGLRAHLDEALRQNATLVQLVLWNLPGRDCGRLATNGELAWGELPRYKQEFVDPIAAILADPAYARLRVVTVVEPNSLPYLVTHVQPRSDATLACEYVKAAGSYTEGIGYALAKLGAIRNVYSYLDISHHGNIGWDDNRKPTLALLVKAATSGGSRLGNVHGFIANTANYSVLREEFIVKTVINGQHIQQTRWVDWNPFIDELSFVDFFRTEAVAAGFTAQVGVLLDTSRNGWGGPNRPTKPGYETNVDVYVETSRIDRRARIWNWCNQVGTGLGERPVAAPRPNVDAYVWMKPPGESDGGSIHFPNSEELFNRECDPYYDGRPNASPDPTGAWPDAPPAGHWHSAQFRELLRNAHPAL